MTSAPHQDEPAAGQAFLAAMWRALGGDAHALSAARFVGVGELPSAFAVTDLAAASVAVAGLAVSEWVSGDAQALRSVTVDRRLASFWFGTSLRGLGWSPPPAWDPLAGDYLGSDGWIRLHTNAPHHRAAALAALGIAADAPVTKADVVDRVAHWAPDVLEAAVVERGGCAAAMHSKGEWALHAQGRALGPGPLLEVQAMPAVCMRPSAAFRAASPDRPLEGIRVLDLTRVLAGPVATRFLAGFGADVLRIDPPGWDESVVPEVTLGKRCARLDLRAADDRALFESLLAQADVLVHGYRPGALERLAYGLEQRHEIRPGLVDVSLNAYGWSGPWSARRGFDSLVQMSAGIADSGMRRFETESPRPLPVQALDQATGYLMAAAVLRGLTERRRSGAGCVVRASLAQTAALLVNGPAGSGGVQPIEESEADLGDWLESTAWGPARRVRSPCVVDGVPMFWRHPAGPLGAAVPRFSMPLQG